MFNGPLKLDTKRSPHAIAPDGLELAVLAPQLMGSGPRAVGRELSKNLAFSCDVSLTPAN